jgi:hypothetical protein
MHPDWNIKFLLLEPGGIKTEYAGTSMVFADRHPAYAGPEYPTSQLLSYLSNPNATADWGNAEDVAQILFHAISRKGDKPLPLRLPMGSDAYAMIMAKNESVTKELAEWETEILSISKEKQLQSIEFLRK